MTAYGRCNLHQLLFITLFILQSPGLVVVVVRAQTTSTNSSSNTNLTTSTSNTTESTQSSMVPTAAPTFLGGISPECSNETASFSQNTNLSNALDELFTEYREEFEDTCPFTVTISECDLNFGGSEEENTTYSLLCDELGGQIYEHSVVLTCGIKPLAQKYDLGVVPECISTSCNVSSDIFDIEMITNPNISDFANSLDNGGCKGGVESGTVSTITVGIAFAGWTVSVMTGFLWTYPLP